MSFLGSYIYDYLTKPLDVQELISSVERCYKYFWQKIRRCQVKDKTNSFVNHFDCNFYNLTFCYFVILTEKS